MTEYTLGTGNAFVFITNLGYILSRYHELASEMREEITTPIIFRDDERVGINTEWFGMY